MLKFFFCERHAFLFKIFSFFASPFGPCVVVCVLWVAERKLIDGVEYMTSLGEDISLSQPPSPSERVVITKAATPKPVRRISTGVR